MDFKQNIRKKEESQKSHKVGHDKSEKTCFWQRHKSPFLFDMEKAHVKTNTD